MTKEDASKIINQYICFCASPTGAMKRLHSFLECVACGFGLAVADRCIKADSEAIHLEAYLLNALGLIEHDTSIRNSWLTENGETLLEALIVARKYEYDPEMMQ